MYSISTEQIQRHVEAELVRARHRFPGTKKLLHAFTEEAGEVTKAFLDQEQKPHKCSDREVFKECIQAIAMAMRLLQEGDPDFPYSPDTVAQLIAHEGRVQ